MGQPEGPISGATAPSYDPDADRSKPANESTIDDIVDAVNAFGRKADEVALGILGPAYEPALGLLKLVQAFSPMADAQDLIDFSHETKEGVVNLDVRRTLTGTADLGAAFASMFVPGSVSGTRKIARAAESGSGPGGGKYRRDIANMPPQQRAKIKGDPPVIPSSPEENIERGYAAIKDVISNGTPNFATMFRKDLGSIAFEPGEVSKNKSGRIVGGGLKKIIALHPDTLGVLPIVIEHGKLYFKTTGKNRRSAELIYNGYKAVFRLNRFGERETWLLTSFSNRDGNELLR